MITVRARWREGPQHGWISDAYTTLGSDVSARPLTNHHWLTLFASSGMFSAVGARGKRVGFSLRVRSGVARSLRPSCTS